MPGENEGVSGAGENDAADGSAAKRIVDLDLKSRHSPHRGRHLHGVERLFLCLALMTLTPACKRQAAMHGNLSSNAEPDHLTAAPEAYEPLRTLKGHWAHVLSVAFSPDGKLLATGSADYRVDLWDTTNWDVRRTLRLGDTVNKVVFSPDGKCLAVAARDQKISLWAVTSGERILTLPESGGAVLFSPDGRTLATLSVWNQTVRLWSRATGKELHTFDGVRGNCLAFSPDGKVLAIGCVDSVQLWDANGKRRMHTVSGRWGASSHFPHGLVKSVAFSPNGKLLASAADDSTVRLWDTAHWKEIRSFGTPKAGITSVVFAPDGKWVAAGSSDATARVWKIATGELVRTFSGHGDWVLSLAFSPDSKHLITANADGTIEVWAVPTR